MLGFRTSPFNMVAKLNKFAEYKDFSFRTSPFNMVAKR